MSDDWALVLAVMQVVGSVGMFGVIWIVQVVHYPLMRMIGSEDFDRYESSHRVRISFVVGPLMALEGVAVLAFLLMRPSQLALWIPWLGAAAEAVAIGVTAFVSAPLHERLGRHHSPELLDRLIATNWIRTAAWTTRAAVAITTLVIVAH